ncbi:MAG: 4-hydroxy-tetrahydrodipicolinate synthase [Sphaerochaetaceae bacterium]|nr:4-hydroxy-tetrahydrodipicolinate synthase [Sphaerochaetaceae bacterium]
MLQGVYTALVTPFNKDGSIDIKAYREFVEYQIHSGVDGLVPVGTTGESPTLSESEKDLVIGIAVEIAAGRLPVIAGTGSNCTSKAIEATKRARDIGANYTLQVSPYYNKPSQEGLYRHFMTVADKGGLPVMLYNVPGRSGVSLSIALLRRLAAHPQIVALKDASGSIAFMEDLLHSLPEDFDILSGDDSLGYPLMSLGGKGIISVASNVYPCEMAKLCRGMRTGNQAESLRIHNRLYPFFVNQFIETNPVPVKTILAERGMMQEVFRLPLCELTSEHRKTLMESLPS